jgi:hypothetical protein
MPLADPLTQWLWQFLLPGYLLTIAIEAPILLAALSRAHLFKTRLTAGIWLTACTYPIVVLVLPLAIPDNRALYLIVAEIFAPLAECILFALAFHRGKSLIQRQRIQDFAAITLANLASFLLGLWWTAG